MADYGIFGLPFRAAILLATDTLGAAPGLGRNSSIMGSSFGREAKSGNCVPFGRKRLMVLSPLQSTHNTSLASILNP